MLLPVKRLEENKFACSSSNVVQNTITNIEQLLVLTDENNQKDFMTVAILIKVRHDAIAIIQNQTGQRCILEKTIL